MLDLFGPMPPIEVKHLRIRAELLQVRVQRPVAHEREHMLRRRANPETLVQTLPDGPRIGVVTDAQSSTEEILHLAVEWGRVDPVPCEHLIHDLVMRLCVQQFLAHETEHVLAKLLVVHVRESLLEGLDHHPFALRDDEVHRAEEV